MKLLFDQNISYRIVNKVSVEFPESKHVSHLGLNDAEDIDIWNFARKENYVIVTFDSDYFDISLINGCPPKVIWLRTGNSNTQEIANSLLVNFEIIRNFIQDPESADKSCLEIDN
jgi:predicted nuclease of predicted toxin-antitoxin system